MDKTITKLLKPSSLKNNYYEILLHNICDQKHFKASLIPKLGLRNILIISKNISLHTVKNKQGVKKMQFLTSCLSY